MNLNPKKIEIPSKLTYKLDKMLAAAAECGNPQFGRKTILVAGTNGKGSTCSYLTFLFLGAGLRVGTYISPHVMSRCERIRINGKNISELLLKKYEKRYERVLSPLSYFERMTLLAFLIFRDSDVDLQILEVGVGGRLDATNISDPDISVITRVDLDHQDVLGKTLTKIAAEKAGIIRVRRPIFISPQHVDAMRVVMRHAKDKNASLARSWKLHFAFPVERELRNISNRRGLHQQQNARLAVSVYEWASKSWGVTWKNSTILRALRKNLPLARIQIVRKSPLFIVDGSHNENSISALVAYLKTHERNTKFRIIFGAMGDKPAKKMLSALRPWTKEIFFPIFYSERQIPAKSLAKNRPSALVQNLKTCVLKLWNGDAPVLVAGSLYLAGEVLNILKKKGICVEPDVVSEQET